MFQRPALTALVEERQKAWERVSWPIVSRTLSLKLIVTSVLHFAYSRGTNKLCVFVRRKKVRYQHEIDDLA